MQRRRLITSGALLVFFATSVLAANEKTHRAVAAYRDGAAGMQSGDYDAYLDGMERALADLPGHPILMIHVARANALKGNTEEAFVWLERVIDAGADFGFDRDERLASLRDDDRFRMLLRRAESYGPRGACDEVYRLAVGDMLPEGIAHDSMLGSFYIGSVRHKKIIQIDKKGKISDLVVSGQDGLRGVLGLRVDAKRRHLWAVSTAMAGMEGWNESVDGGATAHCFDIDTGKTLRSFVFSPEVDGEHNFNDIVVAEDGRVYITDAITGAIFSAAPGDTELDEWVAAGVVFAPNGLVLSNDGRRLYVSQYTLGLVGIDTQTRAVEPLTYPDGAVVAGIDGLYLHGNSLIAVQNIPGLERVSQFWLGDAGASIVRARILERRDERFHDPTTGAVVGDHLYFIANSQLPRVGRGGEVPQPELFDDTFILKVELER